MRGRPRKAATDESADKAAHSKERLWTFKVPAQIKVGNGKELGSDATMRRAVIAGSAFGRKASGS